MRRTTQGINLARTTSPKASKSKAYGLVRIILVTLSGVLNCPGLINAEEITVKFDRGMDIGSVGGSRITIVRDRRSGSFFNIFSLGRHAGVVRVSGAIEGDVIELENVHTLSVTGNNVKIGDGCEIGVVRYSGEVKISDKATVGRTEKV